MDIETLLAYGATPRGCSMLRERMQVTTVQLFGEYVRGYRAIKAEKLGRGYRFHTFLGCDQLGPLSATSLLEAYERWELAVLVHRHCQHEPHAVMV